MKILKTERLALRQMTTDDAEFMLELMNEPAFIQNVADRNIKTIQDAAGYIASKTLPSYDQFGFGFYMVELKNSDVQIGICGLVKRDALEDVDIGFAFLERFWGNGYAWESAEAVMTYALTELRLTRIVGVTAPNNASSIKLLEKLGQFEKVIHLPGYGSESKLFS